MRLLLFQHGARTRLRWRSVLSAKRGGFPASRHKNDYCFRTSEFSTVTTIGRLFLRRMT